MVALAFISTVITVAFILLTLHLGNKLENRFLRGIIIFIGVIVSVVLAATIQQFMGAPLQVATLYGKYFGYMLVSAAILKYWIFRRDDADDKMES